MTKTAVWSVPVVTAALAAPTLAASTGETVDLDLQGRQSGGLFEAYSPDRLQMYQLGMTSGFDAVNVGAALVPAGTIVTLSFDSRMMSEPTVKADGAALESAGTRTEGNATVASFLLPVEIPAGGMVFLDPEVTLADPLPWATDIEPYTVTISPPEGVEDVNPGNNSSVSSARYHETHDAELAVTWREHDLLTSGGDPLPIYVHDTVRITANAPGEIPSGSSLKLSDLSTYDGSEYVGVYEDVRIVSATLDGKDVADQFEDAYGGGFRWHFHAPIRPGQELVVDVDVDVTTSTREFVHRGASTNLRSMRDRDTDNNTVDAELVP